MPEVHRELAYAKLTRTLRVVGRRADGLHLIEAEMVTIGLADELDFFPAPTATIDVVAAADARDPEGLLAGIPRDGTNLVVRALQLAGAPASVVLRKRIPAGAGLGGGSADAAAALRYAGRADVALAESLGSDVPFCLEGGRAEVSGVGEVIRHLPPLALDFVVLTPALVVSTAAVYGAYDDLAAPGSVAARVTGGNDLEAAALVVEPRLGRYRDLFAEVAHRSPRLAGSGASWFVECASAREARVLGSALDAALESDGMPGRVNVCPSVVSPS